MSLFKIFISIAKMLRVCINHLLIDNFDGDGKISFLAIRNAWYSLESCYPDIQNFAAYWNSKFPKDSGSPPDIIYDIIYDIMTTAANDYAG